MDTMLATRTTIEDIGVNKLLNNSRPTFNGQGIEHLSWMLTQMLNPEWSDGKRNRWLGWAQCLATQMRLLTLDQCKAINRACSCEDEGCPFLGQPHIHSDGTMVSYREKPIIQPQSTGDHAVLNLLDTAETSTTPGKVKAVLLGGPAHERVVELQAGSDIIETRGADCCHTYKEIGATWPGDTQALVYVYDGARPIQSSAREILERTGGA